MIANAARIHSLKPRNNDLMVCDEIYQRISNKEMVRWYHKEMEAEEIRAYISKCRFLVASRFHAMIAALEKKVPVLLIGWSHKYQEVLDFFELGQYSIDFSSLNTEELERSFDNFIMEENNIRRKLDENYDKVMDSSRKNIQLICDEVDKQMQKPYRQKGILDYRNPDRYIGEHLICRKGYAEDESIRANAASGGMVTAFLCYLLRKGEIDGAWVTKTRIKDGKLGYETLIATTEEQIRSASSSIYMDMPLLKHLDMLRAFDGRVAVVLTPCKMRALNAILDKDVELQKKIILKLGLFCSGDHSDKATLLSFKHARISLEGAKRLYYRRGHWRGMSTVIYEDGSEKNFSYTKTICAYKNAYFFEKNSCMTCQDHYAFGADISFGDLWLKEMKKDSIKHTGCVIRSEKARSFYEAAVKDGVIHDSYLSDEQMLRAQKRALVFKFTCASAKEKKMEKLGRKVSLEKEPICRWNHVLAFTLAEFNRKFSEEHYEIVSRIPCPIIYYYMCFIRVLLSF